ncbi:hypothetical protein EUGRSUZ_H03491 [Eucalyptus grandis]|uniref:Uncharacterized protein n=2 Tax=Eucalyptus grandis TaxID=71139 RepID=A0ACC3JUZ4_EUCGR|nr:hypothetical protein EUGRSUZ_H03491 [Eucalyptus grandis]
MAIREQCLKRLYVEKILHTPALPRHHEGEPFINRQAAPRCKDGCHRQSLFPIFSLSTVHFPRQGIFLSPRLLRQSRRLRRQTASSLELSA